ncbi:shikimate dehydrogenase [Lachnoclostridium sp. Marseille-P6806]|uniref:shikimate dehydrogenase n=1 Tax=Lachnoclostridium sp. Marseille-P6806 TaxID=2364793 RepID=UPI001F5E4AF8|nr:shikimate dehydrogenase [Lachnoclostridium sp. Marseille-P6806]
MRLCDILSAAAATSAAKDIIMEKISEISGKTRLCGLIGCPVEHTLSPAIHHALAAQFSHDLIYMPFLVERDLEAAVKGAYALNVLGLNVTVPYKQAVLPFLRETDPLAARIGAVNTLVRTDGGYCGCNTDISGLRRALELRQIFLEGQAVIIIGAGGAARSAAYLCAEEKARRIYILNRTAERAIALREELCAVYPDIRITAGGLSAAAELPERNAVAIQCTSVGLFPHAEESPVESEVFFDRIRFALDLIYRPRETAFLRKVREHGGQTENGLQMLLCQAIESYELWNGVRVSPAAAERVRGVLERTA